MASTVFRACVPHAKKTTPRSFPRKATARTTSSVKGFHILLFLRRWDSARWARTVRLVFSHKTPNFAKGVKSLKEEALVSIGLGEEVYRLP